MGHRSDWRIKRSVNLDPGMAAWVKAEAKRLSTSDNTIIRQAIRAAMDAALAAAPVQAARQAAPADGHESRESDG